MPIHKFMIINEIYYICCMKKKNNNQNINDGPYLIQIPIA